MYPAALPVHSPQITWLTNAFPVSHPVSFTPDAVSNSILNALWVLTKVYYVLASVGDEEVRYGHESQGFQTAVRSSDIHNE